MTPELYRPLRVDRIGAVPVAETLAATPDECRQVATRLDIPAVLSLDCRFVLWREGREIVADADLTARVVRMCVVSLDPFETDISQRVRLRFVPEDLASDEIDIDRDDEIIFAGDSIDLGEAAVEELALCLDPYPRRPQAEPPLALDAFDDPGSPFTGLRGRLQ